tara:strand:+ start:2013 stop:3257 length:1245 start_codon:yes stop_codon:yes gene_type:complete
MKNILIRAPLLTRSGYGEHARLIVDALSERPDLFNLHVEAIPWGATPWITDFGHKRKYYDFLIQKRMAYTGEYDLSLQVTVPTEFKKYAHLNIGVTAGIESDRVCPSWIQHANIMDLMLVTSKHAQSGFMRNDVKAKLPSGQVIDIKYTVDTKVINYPVKYTDAKDLSEKIVLENDYNFLTVAQWGPRKNLPNLIKWFVEEFHNEDVGLVVKTNRAKNCLADRMVCTDMLRQILGPYPDKKCKIHLVHGNMTEEEIHGLYVHPKIKSYVTTTHGEGYGLPIFEAAYSGMPVAAPGWSGHMDFLCISKEGKKNRQTMFEKIGFDIKPIQEEAHWEGILEKGSQWCYAKEHKTKAAMRKLYKDYKVKKKTAEKLKDSLLETHAEDVIYEQIISAVTSILPNTDAEWQSEVGEVATI